MTALDENPHAIMATAPGGGEVTLRPATDADEAQLQAFFASITMDADLQLAVHRSPSLLELYRMQGGAWELWVAELGGAIAGMGALLARDGYADGRPVRLGYLGDLRLAREIRGREVLSAMYGPVLDGFARRHGVDTFLTAVIASNQRAVRALTGPGARAAGIPEYHLLRRFDIRAVHLLQPRRVRSTRAAGVDVRPATQADVADIAAFLDSDARTRPFGVATSVRELERRLDAWPGLAIDDFLLAHRDGSLVGTMAPWDATPVKRTVVEAYRGPMRRVRVGYNAAATLLGAPRLPGPGGQLRYLYATHNAVAGDDPRVQRALLGAAYAAHRRSGNVFLSCFVPEGDPLAPAYRGFVCNDLPAHLYAVQAHGAPLAAAVRAAGRPAFEMALV